MKKHVSTLIIAIASLTTTNVWAYDDDGSYTSYDSIVNELKASAEDNQAPEQPDLNWDEVSLHVGMAYLDSFPVIRLPEGSIQPGILNGFEVFTGANLFSKKVRGEIAFRNYLSANTGMSTVKLREFQARVLALPPINDNNLMRMGLGFGMRYMDVNAAGLVSDGSVTTPAVSLILGFEHRFTRSIAVGPDLSYYSPMSATFDKSSWDGAIRLNATF